MIPLPDSVLYRGMSIVTDAPAATEPDPIEPDDPLAPYYGVGAGLIAIRYSPDAVTLDDAGRVTALQNMGGAGAMFDATVTGTPLAVADGMIQFDQTGYAAAANVIDLNGVHLMYLADLAEFTVATRILGGSGFEIRTGINATTGWLLQTWSNLSGAATTTNLSTNRQTNTRAKRLIEHRFFSGVQTTWVDGVQVGSNAIIATDAEGHLPVDRIGAGSGPTGITTGFRGGMGSILGVTLGSDDDATVVAAARAALIAERDAA